MIKICDGLGMLPEEQVRIIDFYNRTRHESERWRQFSPMRIARLPHMVKKKWFCVHLGYLKMKHTGCSQTLL